MRGCKGKTAGLCADDKLAAAEWRMAGREGARSSRGGRAQGRLRGSEGRGSSSTSKPTRKGALMFVLEKPAGP